MKLIIIVVVIELLLAWFGFKIEIGKWFSVELYPLSRFFRR